MMDSTRAKRIEEAFAVALDTPPFERDALLLELLPEAAEQSEVRRLLARHALIEASGEAFLEGVDPGLAGALLKATASVPERIGRYRVERQLARGGYGVVFLAHDPDLDRPVAIKLLPQERVWGGAARDRLKAEARTVSALDHPHIATVHEIGESEAGELYIVMSYYAGETLRERLGRGPLPVNEVQRIAMEIADALAAAHARGIVHRDVKPENVILTGSGVRLVDFGVATTTDATRRLIGAGTVAYMSPEQFGGVPPDPRADVWSLGVMLYELLTGQRPFQAADAVALRDVIRNIEPAPVRRLRPDVPEQLARTVHDCLARAPRNRPADGADVRRLLEPGRTGRRAMAVAAMALISVGAIAGVLVTRRPDPTHLQPRGPTDPVAESLYVRGMALLDRRTPDDLEQAAVLLRTAIERDSTFARAYAGLVRIIEQARVERPSDRYARTRPLLERAAALDPDQPDVLDELGWVRMWYDRDLPAAERYFRRALELDPLNPWRYHYYAAWQSLIGRIDEAVDLERQAMAVDPRGAATATHVALHLTLQRKNDEAIRLLEQALETDTTWGRTHMVLGRAYLSAGRYEEALVELRRDNYQFAGFDTEALLAYGLGVAGQREEALEITARFEARARDGYTNPVNLMACYLGLGEIELALDWAERIPDDRGVLWFPRSDDMFEPLFLEPRFQRVLERVGLDSATVSRFPDTRADIAAILKPARSPGS